MGKMIYKRWVGLESRNRDKQEVHVYRGVTKRWVR